MGGRLGSFCFGRDVEWGRVIHVVYAREQRDVTSLASNGRVVHRDRL